MDIKGSILLFPERKTDKKGNSFIACTTSVNRKRSDGSPLYKSMDVIFDAANFPSEKLAKLDPACYYCFDVKTGWITVDAYTNKAGETVTKFVVFVREGELKEKKVKNLPSEKKPDGGLW